MKKITLATIIGMAACLTSFAQGNLTFSSATASSVWNNYTTPGTSFRATATLNVGLFVSTTVGAARTAAWDNNSFAATNGIALGSWAGILTDPNYRLALSTVAGGTPVINTCGGVGPQAGQYSGGIVYLQDTAVGQQVSLFVLAWDKSFGATPTLAAQAGAPVGMSKVINYTLGSAAAPGGSLNNAGIGGFGVLLVPEPSTFALAGLGAAAMLIFRRRK